MVAEAFSPAAKSPLAPAGRACGAVLRRGSKMVLSSTVGGGGSNCALTRPSARSARSGRSCKTARRSPSLTTRAPNFSAALVSALSSLAPCAGGLTTRPCSKPGKAKSDRKSTAEFRRVLFRSAIPDHEGAELLGGAGIGAEQFGAVRGGSHDAAMQQARKSEIGGVFSLAGDLVQRVLAGGGMRGDGELRDGLQRHVGQVALDALAFDQLRVGDAFGGRGGVGDDAGLDL